MRKKKGSYSDVLKGVQGKLFCLKLNLEFGHQFSREIAFGKIF
jgi:predicted nucleic-acid-binding protein